MDYVFIDGQRLTPYMAYQFKRMKNAFFLRFALILYITSGLRLAQEQIDIFLSRYVPAGRVNGRWVYDTRFWNGTRYYRISSAGTVAVPSTSNHEIQGTDGAIDIADSGNTPGVTRANNERSNWIRENAHEFDMEPEGYNFNEPWHLKVRHIFNNVPLEDDVALTKEQEEALALIPDINQKLGWVLVGLAQAAERDKAIQEGVAYAPEANQKAGWLLDFANKVLADQASLEQKQTINAAQKDENPA